MKHIKTSLDMILSENGQPYQLSGETASFLSLVNLQEPFEYEQFEFFFNDRGISFEFELCPEIYCPAPNLDYVIYKFNVNDLVECAPETYMQFHRI